MNSKFIAQILQRDLKKTKEELHQYADEQAIWQTVPGITNSAGNLALHLAGNLRHFIGSLLGKTGYVRDRDREFSDKNISLEELDILLDATSREVGQTLEQLGPAVLAAPFPIEKGGVIHETGYMLLHLTAHLSYHLGQINYHRRIISSHEMEL